MVSTECHLPSPNASTIGLTALALAALAAVVLKMIFY
jgi:hypothetical protein